MDVSMDTPVIRSPLNIECCLQGERTEMFLISVFIPFSHLYLSPVPIAPVDCTQQDV